MEPQRSLRKRKVEMQPTENPKTRLKNGNNQDREPLPSTHGDAQRNDEESGEREKLLEQIKQLKKEFRVYRNQTNQMKKTLEDKDMQLKKMKEQQLKIKKELQKAEEERMMLERATTDPATEPLKRLPEQPCCGEMQPRKTRLNS